MILRQGISIKMVMKKRSGLHWIALVFVLMSSLIQAQTFELKTYPEDDSNFANPERGFYHHTETQSGSYSFLNAAELKTYREEGVSLILRLFYLNDFASTMIPERYLSSMQQDFNAARAAGVKMIVRFAYTKKSTSPYGDATPEWALKHIAQLKPVLHANEDVIAVVQAGFIGAWGEWYYTDHFSATLGNPNASDWVNRRALINALLDATPASRAVQVRTPAIKFSLTESTVALSDDEAFKLTQKARLGHHNDCFLASESDFGTYTSNEEAEKAFLEQETKYLPMGGETCNVSVPLSECPNAMAQMERFHWSYLNRDYHGSVIGSWESDDCLDEVYKNLGYRFRMTKASLQKDARPGSLLKLNVSLVNDGWANPYNKRSVEVVLRNSTTGKLLTVPVDTDPRRWVMDDTIKLSLEAGLPANITSGNYEVFLNFPDPDVRLKNNPSYSIRLANTDVWESTTGFNKLNHLLVVSSASFAPAYTGDVYFSFKNSAAQSIGLTMDGLKEDWAGVETFAADTNPELFVKVYNANDNLYFLLQGISANDPFEIFLDVDNTISSGELTAPWSSHYADYRINQDGISFFLNGVWSTPESIVINKGTDFLELQVVETLFSQEPLMSDIFLAVHLSTSGNDVYIPSKELTFAKYPLLLDAPSPLKHTSSGNKVILYWANESDNVARVIERSDNGADFEIVAIASSGQIVYSEQLTAGATYRSYTFNEVTSQVSPWSDELEVELTARPVFYEFVADGNPSEWEDVPPLSTSLKDGETVAYRIFVTAQTMNILMEGIDPDSYVFYFDMDNSTATGSEVNPWSYAGFDFVIKNNAVFDLRSGAEVNVGSVTESATPGYLEISAPISLFDNLGSNTAILTAALVSVQGDQYFPDIDRGPLKYIRILSPPTPEGVTVGNSETSPETQLIVQWLRCTGCTGYIVERAEETPEDFTVVAEKGTFTFVHYDNALTTGKRYYYRVYSFNEAGISAPSEPVSAIPAAVTATEHSLQRVFVYPNPVSTHLVIEREQSLNGFVIYNARGESLRLPASHNKTKTIIDFAFVPSGLYLIKIIGTSQVIKIIKK
jgi:hypothetical protein